MYANDLGAPSSPSGLTEGLFCQWGWKIPCNISSAAPREATWLLDKTCTMLCRGSGICDSIASQNHQHFLFTLKNNLTDISKLTFSHLNVLQFYFFCFLELLILNHGTLPLLFYMSCRPQAVSASIDPFDSNQHYVNRTTVTNNTWRTKVIQKRLGSASSVTLASLTCSGSVCAATPDWSRSLLSPQIPLFCLRFHKCWKS